jgi:hypothetical protein
MSDQHKSFWFIFQGVVAKITALIVAVTALLTVLFNYGMLGGPIPTDISVGRDAAVTRSTVQPAATESPVEWVNTDMSARSKPATP